MYPGWRSQKRVEYVCSRFPISRGETSRFQVDRINLGYLVQSLISSPKHTFNPLSPEHNPMGKYQYLAPQKILT